MLSLFAMSVTSFSYTATLSILEKILSCRPENTRLRTHYRDMNMISKSTLNNYLILISSCPSTGSKHQKKAKNILKLVKNTYYVYERLRLLLYSTRRILLDHDI